MIRILITTILLLISFYTNAQQDIKESTNQITVKVKEIPLKKGTLRFALFNEEGFLPKKPVATATCLVKDKSISVVFDSIPNGTYAVMCYLDENNNQQFDFDLNTGMPMELYGVSNNPILYGPPQFKDAKFNLQETNTSIEIELQE